MELLGLKKDKLFLSICLVIFLNVCVSESTYSNNNYNNQNYNYNYQNYGRNLNPVNQNVMNQNPLLKRWDLSSILMGRLRNGLELIQGSRRTNNYKSNANGHFNPSAYTNYQGKSKSNHGYDYNYDDYNYNYNSIADETQGRGFNSMDSSSWIPQSPQSQFYDFNMADVVHTYQDSYWQDPQPKSAPLSTSKSKSVSVRSKGYSIPEVNSKPMPKKKSRRQTVPLPSITERSIGYDNSRSRTRASRWSSQHSSGRYGNKNKSKGQRSRGRAVNVEGQWPNCGYDVNSFDQRCCFEEDANLRTTMKMDEAQGYLVADRTSYYWDDNRGRCLQSLPVPMHHTHTPTPTHTSQTNYIDQTEPYEEPGYDNQYQMQYQDSYSDSNTNSYTDSNSDYNYNYNNYDQNRGYDQKTSPSQSQKQKQSSRRSRSESSSGSWPESSSGSTSEYTLTSYGGKSPSKSKSISKPISSTVSKSKTYSQSTSKKSTSKPKPKYQKSTPKTKLQLMNTRSFRGTTYQLYKEMPETVSSSTSIYY